MKSLKLLSLLFVLSIFFMTSCKKENIDIVEKTEEVKPKVENNILTKLQTTNTDGLELGCFTINYPFQMVTINGTTLDINNEAEFEAAVNEPDDYVVDFGYPLTVVTEAGQSETVNDVQELGELFAACIPDAGWENGGFPAFLINEDGACNDFVYPLTLIDLDSNTVTVANEQEFIDAIASNNILFFVFPFDITNDSLGVVTVTSPEDLFTYLSLCQGQTNPCDTIFFGNELACYEIQFPISFVLADGSTVTANNVNELNSLLLNGEAIGFAYPVQLLNPATGELLTINNEEEMNLAFEACGYGGGPDNIITQLLSAGQGGCFTVNFPLTGVDVDRNAVNIENVDQLYEAAYNGTEVDLPVTVQTNDGVDHVINSIEDLVNLLNNC